MATEPTNFSQKDIERIAGELDRIQRLRFTGDNPPPDLQYRGQGVYYSPSTGLQFMKFAGGLRAYTD